MLFLYIASIYVKTFHTGPQIAFVPLQSLLLHCQAERSFKDNHTPAKKDIKSQIHWIFVFPTFVFNVYLRHIPLFNMTPGLYRDLSVRTVKSTPTSGIKLWLSSVLMQKLLQRELCRLCYTTYRRFNTEVLFPGFKCVTLSGSLQATIYHFD